MKKQNLKEKDIIKIIYNSQEKEIDEIIKRVNKEIKEDLKTINTETVMENTNNPKELKKYLIKQKITII